MMELWTPLLLQVRYSPAVLISSACVLRLSYVVCAGVGTYFYTAPEVSQGSQGDSSPSNGHARYDEKCDLYSLGIILFELFHPGTIEHSISYPAVCANEMSSVSCLAW